MIFTNRRTNRQLGRGQANPFHSGQQRGFSKGQNAGGLLQNITNTRSMANLANKGVNGLSKTLNNVQQVMNVVQSAAPVVQEYGPIVKNLPAMYRMMKALNEVDSDSAEKKDQDHHNENTQTQLSSDSSNKGSNENIKEAIEENQGKSTPKLFI